MGGPAARTNRRLLGVMSELQPRFLPVGYQVLGTTCFFLPSGDICGVSIGRVLLGAQEQPSCEDAACSGRAALGTRHPHLF